MKKLTSKQLDAKFAKAAKLAAQLQETLNEIHAGCETFRYGFGNATALMNGADRIVSTIQDERTMHKADK